MWFDSWYDPDDDDEDGNDKTVMDQLVAWLWSFAI